jgi:hypothetical protein
MFSVLTVDPEHPKMLRLDNYDGEIVEVQSDPTWLTDARIREIKRGDDATKAEALALAGEVRERRRSTEPLAVEREVPADYAAGRHY